MDFWRTVLVLVRRWYVTVPAFLLSVGLALAIYSTVTTRYVSTSILVLTMPTSGPSTVAGQNGSGLITNPMLNFDQGLSTSALILIRALGTPEMGAELGVLPGSDTTYQVTNGSSNPELAPSSPFVFIQGESSSASDARSVVERVVRRARGELDARQRQLDAPPATYITVSEVVRPTTPEELGGSKKRVAGAVGMLGLFVSLAAVYGIESIASARRRRRTAS